MAGKIHIQNGFFIFRTSLIPDKKDSQDVKGILVSFLSYIKDQDKTAL